MSFSPLVLNVPAGQFSHVVEDVSTSNPLYFPGPQDKHLEAPSLLKPVPHVSQKSVAPVEKLFAGHLTMSVWDGFPLNPAGTVEQYDAPGKAKVPPSQATQPDSEFTPDSAYRPAEQSLQDVDEPALCLYFPGGQTEHDADPALLKPLAQDVQTSVAPVE